MADVHGSCEPRFEGVRTALSASLDSGADVGASVAVFLHGEPVVDIWGGYVDEAKSAPWERDTLTNVWSTTKTMTFLCALMLADRHELDFHAPVATYWPEFAQGGKEAVEVRHVMGHTAGLSGWEQPIEPQQLADWELCISALAAQAPWWEPGSASGYHALTQGYLIGEIVRRITGESIGAWFAKEVARPLGADFFIGLPASEDARVSNVIPPPPIDPDQMEVTEIMAKTFLNPPLDASMAHEEWWRRAEIPAANGHGNARSVARIQSVVACGGEVDGVRLLSPATIDRIFEEQANGVDLVLGLPIRFGIGYGLAPTSALPYLPDRRICFWGGYGGSAIVIDTEHRAVFSYVMNKMAGGVLGSDRATHYGTSFFAALG
jgi:CubicO group peptidase (beta-lactamase class C family)